MAKQIKQEKIKTNRDFLPGSIIVSEYTPKRKYTAGVRVWHDAGKLYVKIPVEGDHPLQVEIDTLEKVYDVYGHD